MPASAATRAKQAERAGVAVQERRAVHRRRSLRCRKSRRAARRRGGGGTRRYRGRAGHRGACPARGTRTAATRAVGSRLGGEARAASVPGLPPTSRVAQVELHDRALAVRERADRRARRACRRGRRGCGSGSRPCGSPALFSRITMPRNSECRKSSRSRSLEPCVELLQHLERRLGRRARRSRSARRA